MSQLELIPGGTSDSSMFDGNDRFTKNKDPDRFSLAPPQLVSTPRPGGTFDSSVYGENDRLLLPNSELGLGTRNNSRNNSRNDEDLDSSVCSETVVERSIHKDKMVVTSNEAADQQADVADIIIKLISELKICK